MLKQRSTRRHKTSRSSLPIELLENRRLLSASTADLGAPLTAYPAVESLTATPATSASPTGYTPSQIRSAYGISNISFNGVTGDGTGQTIAIVVAYDDPKFVDTGTSGFATSDLGMFDKAFGIADPPSFKKVNEYGETPTDVSSNAGWAEETALDVEWAHAIAPKASILLVEAYNDSVQQNGTSDLMRTAILYAAKQPGVSVVSLSFGTTEFSNESSYDGNFVTPSGHAGVTFVTSSGDHQTVTYPAASPNVVGVGGTTLTLNGSNYSSESAWAESGGGASAYESKPSYQYNVGGSSNRETPDVSFNGSTLAGVAVYDSYNNGTSTPWYPLGGTSVSTPSWAALVAITDQGRAKLGLSTLDGASQTLPRLYELNSADFHDITTTGSGAANSATSGYDLITGRGTPVANTLVPDLAGGNSITGTMFLDNNDNGKYDSGDTTLTGWGTFLDIYLSGTRQGIDPYTLSTSNGAISMTDVVGGTFRMTQGTVSGYTRTTPRDLLHVDARLRQSPHR